MSPGEVAFILFATFGVVIAGGHSIQDQEPKYGLIVLGFVDPERMLTKGNARPGDALVLSKPLGFGTTTTALKGGHADAEHVSEVSGWMKRLNQTTAELAVEFGLSAGTDITGFGFLGHAGFAIGGAVRFFPGSMTSNTPFCHWPHSPG